jgi:DNA-binding response OmpR family regulator
MTSGLFDKLRVYLIEDTTDLRDEMVFGLSALGLDVTGFSEAAGLYRALAASPCDIVLIDIGLPGENGFSIGRHLRANRALGLVYLSARASLEDRLQGLELGADAYLVKPVDVRELAATLHAVHRRMQANPALLAQATQAVQAPARWRLGPDDWTLRNPLGQELNVSDSERRFLKIMLPAAGQVVARETLINAFAQDVDDYDPHRLDAVISRLRKRAEQAGLGSLPLLSVRGTGYVFNA